MTYSHLHGFCGGVSIGLSALEKKTLSWEALEHFCSTECPTKSLYVVSELLSLKSLQSPPPPKGWKVIPVTKRLGLVVFIRAREE